MTRFRAALLTLLASGCLSPTLLHAQSCRTARYPVAIPGRFWAVTDSIPWKTDSLRTRIDSLRWERSSNMPGVLVVVGPRREVVADSLCAWQMRGWLIAWDRDRDGASDSTAGRPSETGAEAGRSAAAWNHVMLGADTARMIHATGRGQLFGGVDSGGDPTHPGYTLAGGRRFTRGDTLDFRDDLSECRGHGTHVIGIGVGHDVGVAPDALGYAARVFELVNGECKAYQSTAIAATSWLLGKGVRVINWSIYYPPSGALTAYAAYVASRGAALCISTGNHGGAPAGGTDTGVGVTAVDQSGGKPGFAAYGDGTDFALPGVGINSTMPGGGYGEKTGTSQAAPHCAVLSLLFAERPELTVAEALAIACRYAIPRGPGMGCGTPQIHRSIADLRGGVALIDSTWTQTSATEWTKDVAFVAVSDWSVTSSAPWLRVEKTGPSSIRFTVTPALASRDETGVIQLNVRRP